MLDWAVQDGELRIGWNSQAPLNLASGDNLLVITLKTTGEFTAGKSIRFVLASDPLNELADDYYNVIPDAVLSVDVIESSSIGISEEQGPGSLMLGNHPNPFEGYTNITYSLPVDGKVLLVVNSLLGMNVKTLVDEHQQKGDYMLKLDSYTMAPGVYTVTLRLDTGKNVYDRTIKLVRKK